MKLKLFLILLFLFIGQTSFAQEIPKLTKTDEIRIAEAYRLGQKLSDKVWKDWNKTTFSTLLVTPENEFLIRNSNPSDDFSVIGYNSSLISNVYWRKRIFNPSFLATFPAVGGVSTIVIGQAENTSVKTSTPWVITFLHEHFHQMQDSQLNIYADIEKLELSGGDQTGMWMLNYKFPYEDEKVKNQFEKLSQQLADLLETQNKKELRGKVENYLALRKEFKKSLNTKDYKYFSFQLWKEGVARYTQLKIAELASKKYKPSKQYRQLKDFTSFEDAASELRKQIINELKTLELDKYKRVAFYPFGAGEALVLDQINPEWKKLYWTDKFYLEEYF